MVIRKALFLLVLATLLSPWSVTFSKNYDVLELPAVPSKMAEKSTLFHIGKYGSRYFVAGQMGFILYSDDGGKSWTQAQVPVRSTLLDVFFFNDKLGWAVGHEGVILHSSDGGKNWVKQYDGLRYGTDGLAYYRKLEADDPENENYPPLVSEMEFAVEQGADRPLFKIYFFNENDGQALGAYGMALATNDGGNHWRPNLEKFENDNFNHYYDFSPLPDSGRFFISGEAGLFLIGDFNTKSTKRVHSIPWEGSFFTSSAATDGAVIFGGLRGRMFRTGDEGQTWIVVDKPPTSALVASTRLGDGRLVFAGVAGEILVSTDNGFSFNLSAQSGSVGSIFDLTEGEGASLLIVGPQGIKSVILASE